MIYDISVAIHKDMIVYKNRDKKKPRFKQSATFEANGVYETDICMNLHTGTHIDFPLHTIKDGKTSNKQDLSTLIGPATVYDMMHLDEKITADDLKDLDIKKGDFILFKTKNSLDKTFNFEFIYVDHTAAKYLAERKVRGVGIDALGIERAQPDHPTHDTLLNQDIIILEGINLSMVKADSYTLYCLPLKIENVEALPVRAILQK